jgi:FKBP-type peptidyl-prolyl cis-trans isomerase 2
MSVKKGDVITVEYWGTLDDGTQFDSSDGKEPLEFRAGVGEMVKGFDKAVVGMKAGETKEIRIKPEQAYGERNEKMVIEVPLERLRSNNIQPKKGMRLTANGQLAVISAVNKDTAVLDFNHLLAGKALNFKIKLIGIK